MKKHLIATAALGLLAANAMAVELREIEVRTGTDGLSPLSVSIDNRSGREVVCVGELAHWFSAELARAPAGATARIALWFDPETGTTSALNAHKENMPVESLWCGIAGRAYETRSQVALKRDVDAPDTTLALICVLAEDRLVCE